MTQPDRRDERLREILAELCGDERNGGLIRDMAFTVWSNCHHPAHEDGNSDWGNDNLPLVNVANERVREAIRALALREANGVSPDELSREASRSDDIAAASALFQCADCVRAEHEFSCFNRGDVFIIGNEVICRDCADEGHRGEPRKSVPDIAAKLKRQRMHIAQQQRTKDPAK